jgi:hypothetical protein
MSRRCPVFADANPVDARKPDRDVAPVSHPDATAHLILEAAAMRVAA